MGRVRQFQNFTKSKDSRLSSTPDVKDFLAHLAVDCHIAASTQNQAFNAPGTGCFHPNDPDFDYRIQPEGPGLFPSKPQIMLESYFTLCLT